MNIEHMKISYIQSPNVTAHPSTASVPSSYYVALCVWRRSALSSLALDITPPKLAE